MLRWNLELDDAKAAEIENLMELTGMATRKEFFNNAFTLLKWAIAERTQGNEIAAISGDRKVYRELRMPVLENALEASRQPAARAAV
ncbi:MAG TPA: hypothetical protein VKF79_05840 [Candidatus Acidoferrum sp.]|nr:hypothetical protein [Candidatus Acidoferrum sp.]